MLALGTALAAPVHHDGEREGDAIVWTSTVAVTDRCLPLATPLTGEVEGATVEQDALCFAQVGGTATVTTRQPFPDDALRPPLLADVPQRVRLHGARYVPDDRLGLVHGTRSWWSPGLDPGERKGLDRDPRGARAAKSGTRIYVVPDGAITAHGLAGRVWDGRSPWTSAGLVALLGGTLLGLWGAYRGLEVWARRERVQAWLTENGME
ncbi:MAG: hypothetical protein R3F61_04855 [Myxococcota bacterium]